MNVGEVCVGCCSQCTFEGQAQPSRPGHMPRLSHQCSSLLQPCISGLCNTNAYYNTGIHHKSFHLQLLLFVWWAGVECYILHMPKLMQNNSYMSQIFYAIITHLYILVPYIFLPTCPYPYNTDFQYISPFIMITSSVANTKTMAIVLPDVMMSIVYL